MEWQSLVQEQTASGLSARSFCAERGVGVASFYKWRQRFSAASHGPEDSGFSFVDVSTLAMSSGNEACDRRWQIELELGDGLVLRLNRG